MLIFLLMGVIEFGLLFGRKLDISQGAREGARLAAVNYQATSGSSGSTQTSEIVAAVCARMELASNTKITVDTSNGTAVGDTVTFTIKTMAQPVSGVFDPWLANRVLESDVEIRLEQPASFASTTNQVCP